MNAALIAFSYWIACWLAKPLINWMKYRVAPDAMPGSLALDPAKPVVYVLPQRSWIDLFALQRICLELNLPPPARVSHVLPTPDRAGLVYLPALLETFARNRSGDSELARMMAIAADNPDYDIQIVPVSIFWGRDPGKETSLFKLIFADSVQAGRLRKVLIGVANGRNVLANFGKPLGHRDYLISAGVSAEVQASPSQQAEQKLARALPRALHFHFLRARTAALGPTLLRRSVVLKGVIESEAVKEAIRVRARAENSSLDKAEAHARKCAEEIAADYSAATIRVMELVLTAIWNRVFKGVEVQGLERVRALAQSHEIVFMPSHRSHADYLLLSYVLYTAGLVVPFCWRAGWCMGVATRGPAATRPAPSPTATAPTHRPRCCASSCPRPPRTEPASPRVGVTRPGRRQLVEQTLPQRGRRDRLRLGAELLADAKRSRLPQLDQPLVGGGGARGELRGSNHDA